MLKCYVLLQNPNIRGWLGQPIHFIVLGVSPHGVPLTQPAIALVETAPTREQLMLKLLKAASARGGKLTVTQAVLDTGANFTDVEATLKQLVKSGYVYIDNHPATGVVIYDFVEL